MLSELQYTLFIILAPLAALSAAGMLFYAWKTRDPATKIVRTLSWLIIALVGWLAFNTLELLAPTPQLTLLFASITYLFIIAAPVAWLAFALHYSGIQRWLEWPRFRWLLLIPLINLAGVWTNPWHGLQWRSYEFLPVGNLLAMFVLSYGPLFWLLAGYGYIMMVSGAILIGRSHFKTGSIFRGQSRWMLVGAMLPVLTNLIYIFRIFPWLTKDYTAISFVAASMAFVLGISRHDLFRLSPVARERVVDNMADPVLVVDLNLRIADLNPAARRILFSAGSQQRVRVGQRLQDLDLPWSDMAAWVRATGQIEGFHDLEAELDGAWRSYDVRITPITESDTATLGHLIVLRDITERKLSETTLRSYAQALEVRNKELDAFARTVAHDLKTPLVSLVGFSQAIIDLGGDLTQKESQDLLTEINQAGMRMSNIVDALLLLASVRRKEDVQLRVLDMRAIVEEVVRRMAHQIAMSGARVEIMGAEGEPWPQVMGYGPWIEEIWVNYLANALNYGLRAGSDQPNRILLGYDPTPSLAPAGASGADSVPPVERFWVRDWGAGVPESMHADLFTEFTRLSHVKTSGHGLGLSIVRRIADRLDGEVGVESQPGQGSTFWFTLPRFAPSVLAPFTPDPAIDAEP